MSGTSYIVPIAINPTKLFDDLKTAKQLVIRLSNDFKGTNKTVPSIAHQEWINRFKAEFVHLKEQADDMLNSRVAAILVTIRISGRISGRIKNSSNSTDLAET